MRLWQKGNVEAEPEVPLQRKCGALYDIASKRLKGLQYAEESLLYNDGGIINATRPFETKQMNHDVL